METLIHLQAQGIFEKHSVVWQWMMKRQLLLQQVVILLVNLTVLQTQSIWLLMQKMHQRKCQLWWQQLIWQCVKIQSIEKSLSIFIKILISFKMLLRVLGLNYFTVIWDLKLVTWGQKLLRKILFGKTPFQQEVVIMMSMLLKVKLRIADYLFKRWWKQLGQAPLHIDTPICGAVQMVLALD